MGQPGARIRRITANGCVTSGDGTDFPTAPLRSSAATSPDAVP
jgi:hypothetical protein